MKRYDIIITIIIIFIVSYAVWSDQSYKPDASVQIKETIQNDVGIELPPKEFYTDGCTLWLDSILNYNFTNKCIEHDFKYWIGGNIDEKEKADLELRDGINEIVPFMGDIMYGGVKIFGNPILPTPWSWGYGWEK